MPSQTISPTSAAPEQSGMSGAALARIDDHLKRKYVEAGRLAGTQLLVYRRGQIVHNAVQGLADVERKVAVADDTIFRIYSMTKPITTVAFMMLVEEGRVALDEPVHKYIPEWAGLGVFQAGVAPLFLTRPPARPMLIIDLLRHTSGLTYGFQQRTNVDAAYRAQKIGEVEKSGTLASMIADLAKIPLEFSPGEAWNYSVATDVVGYLVEKISGMPFEQFLQQRIFDPLGMVDTGFVVPEDKIPRLVDAWAMAPGNGVTLFDRGEASLWATPTGFCSGGGGLVSSTADYHRFCSMMLAGGTLDGTRILGRKTIELMTMNHLPGRSDLASLSTSLFSETQNAGVGFGLGFAVNQDPARTMLPGSIGEYYWGGMFSTAFFIDPVEQLTMIFMTQLTPSSSWPIRRELKTLIYSALS